MIVRAAVVWILGLLSAVPYAAYRLFFQAPRDEYALLITFILFWVFGYWGLVGPLLAALTVRRVFRAMENAKSPRELKEIMATREARDSMITLIATENRIPKFLAARVYDALRDRWAQRAAPVQATDFEP